VKRCNVCRGEVLVEPYQVGEVRGHLCAVCQQGAGLALAAWTVKRMREAQRERDELERRRNEEREVVASSEALFAEMLPRVRRKAS
jgi:hypothetical protein